MPPAKDTKVLVSWNGLMIAALAEAGRVLREEPYIEAASRAAGFILDRMRREDGRLLHTYKDGQAKLDAYLDDYAVLDRRSHEVVRGIGEPRWIESALDLAGIMIDRVCRRRARGLFLSPAARHEALIARQKDVHDNATPSGNGMAATALVRLGALTGRDDLTTSGPVGAGSHRDRARARAGCRWPEPDRARLPAVADQGICRASPGPDRSGVSLCAGGHCSDHSCRTRSLPRPHRPTRRRLP